MLPEIQDGFMMRHHEPSRTIIVETSDEVEMRYAAEKVAQETELEVTALAIVNSMDAFLYEHYVKGKLKRRLNFGMFGKERLWNTIEGEPEPWEADFFFNKEEYEYQLEDALDDDDPDQKEVVLVKQIYSEKRLRLGVQPPFLGKLGMLAMAEELGLPGAIKPPDGGWTKEELIRKPRKPGLFKRLFGSVFG